MQVFFFFFHFNEALIALRLEITFVLLSSSFPPFLLLIRFFFFLSPVIVLPPNDITCCSFLLPTIFFFLFAFDFSLLSFQVWMQRSPSFISIVRNVSRRCVLGVLSHFFPPLSLLSFPFTRLSYSTSPIRLTPSSRDRYRSSDVDTRPDEFLMERVAEPIARPPSQINRFFFSPARLNELDSKFRSFPFRSFHAYHLPVTV